MGFPAPALLARTGQFLFINRLLLYQHFSTMINIVSPLIASSLVAFLLCEILPWLTHRIAR
jgi:hypothetical protein